MEKVSQHNSSLNKCLILPYAYVVMMTVVEMTTVALGTAYSKRKYFTIVHLTMRSIPSYSESEASSDGVSPGMYSALLNVYNIIIIFIHAVKT